MELIFLYVQRFGQTSRVKKGAFPISPNYHFEHDDKGRTKFTLKITQKEVIPRNFFPKHISNVSFLVGRNGSGKTTVLELMRYVLSLKDQRTSVMGSLIAWSRFLAVFKDDRGELKVFSSLDYRAYGHYHHKRVDCLFDDQILKVHELMHEGLFHKTWSIEAAPLDYPDIATISYTPLFNLRDYPFSFSNPGFIDVSSNFLVQVDGKKERITDPLLAHRRADTRRAIMFIERAKHDTGRWNRTFMAQFIPDRITLKIITKLKSNVGVGELRYMGFDAMGAYDILKQHYLGYNAELIKAVRDGRGKDGEGTADAVVALFRLEILMAAIDGLFDVIEDRGPGFTDHNDYRFPLFTGILDIGTDAKEQPFIEFLNRQAVIPKPVIRNWLKGLEAIQISVEMNDGEEISFEVPVQLGENVLRLDGFLNLVPKKYTEQFQPLLNFDWSDMSSGQKMMLDLFSRIYYAYSEMHKSTHQHDSISFLLDEPEVGFHPQWQREWFNELLIFSQGLTASRFNADGSAGLKCQFIVATNNPMSLSDIPGPCVQYIGRSADAPKTFAANIHELLGDSFYLQNGFIGEFAKEKLESLIRFLAVTKARRTRIWNEVNAWQVIELVGEDVIQRRLVDLYYQKYPKSLPTSESEIKRLKAMLAALEAGKGQ